MRIILFVLFIFLFSGCGNYMADIRLNDIWVLLEMNGEEIKSEHLTKGAPVFEFHLSEKRFAGHSGCNQLSGTIEVDKEKIKFDQIISTKMACPDMQAEQTLLNILSNKTLTYKIEKLKLTLWGENGEKLIFHKID